MSITIVHQGPSSFPVIYDRGGAVERRMVELAASQAANGHTVFIMSGDQHDSLSTHRGIYVQSIKLKSRRPIRDYEFLLKARHYLRQIDPDILHYHGAQQGARFSKAIKAQKVLSVDFFRYRGSESRILYDHYRRSLRLFQRILPVSDACRTDFLNYWGTVYSTTTLYNGVDIVQFAPDAGLRHTKRQELGIDGLIVLYVGRLCSQKGTDILLRAWRGSAPLRATLLLTGPVGQFGLRNPVGMSIPGDLEQVRYLGAVPDSELAALYNACDIFVMPTVHDEMFGMAALEAEACGKPIIASHLGGLSEVVSDRSGIFIAPGDAEALGEAIHFLADNPAIRSEMGIAAREHALRFSWQAIASDSIRIYNSLTC